MRYTSATGEQPRLAGHPPSAPSLLRSAMLPLAVPSPLPPCLIAFVYVHYGPVAQRWRGATRKTSRRYTTAIRQASERTLMIITVGNIKGGVGKTTLAINLAIARAAEGRDVLLVDGDEQRTAQTFTELRT